MQRRGIRPRPGIKARHFDKEIVRKDSKPIQKIFNKEIAQATKRVF
jgi:hypothetical protein